MNVLLVEDDLDLGNGTRVALADEGMQVVWVRRIAEAQHAIASMLCDMVLLDLGLPDGDGLNFLAWLRREYKTMPVIVLTARDRLDDRVRGLDSGADDYLVKPFALAELLSRLRALARRSYGIHAETIALRGLTLHTLTRRVKVNGCTVELSRFEFLLLNALLMRADRVLSRSMLEEQVLPGERGNSNVLDVHISSLRRKIGPGYIRTIRGVGYIIDKLAPAEPLAP